MRFGTAQYFPLNLLDSRLSGYFIASDGKVYSTKLNATPKMLHGSGYGLAKYYTLNGQSYAGYLLLQRAKAHTQWHAQTNASTNEMLESLKARSPSAKSAGARNHAKTVTSGIADKGVVIAQVAVHDGAEHLLFGSKPAIHTTEASYRDEMLRLATAKPGTRFVALKIVASVVSGGLQWD